MKSKFFETCVKSCIQQFSKGSQRNLNNIGKWSKLSFSEKCKILEFGIVYLRSVILG